MNSQLIFERKPLPRYFAVLRPTSGGSPSFQICEYEIQTKMYQERETTIMIVKNAEILMHTVHVDMIVYPPERTDTSIYEYTVRNENQSDIDIRTVKYWFTNQYFFWNEYEIPIVDFTKRYFLTRSFTRILPYNKNAEEMIHFAQTYAALRDKRIKQVDPFCSKEVYPIPQFVIELIVNDQREKNNACPITITSFSTLQNFGLTPCFHLFEYDAIQKWTQKNSGCPVCRKPILSVYKYQDRIEN
jgi:hypothetical protein